MNRLLPLATGAVLGAVVAATGAVVTALPGTETGHSLPLATPAPHQPDPTIARLAQQAVRASIPNASVGVEVFDRQTATVLTTADADRQFQSMSVVKLLIALDVLTQNNGALPDATTQAQLTRMLSLSDDEIANDFWGEDGGPREVVKIANMVGLTGTQPPADPNEWGDTLITAHDMVSIYLYILDKLPAPDRDLLLNAMSNAPRYAADGTDQYFGLPNALPANATWVVKQGWGTSGDGTKALYNTTGVVGADSRYVVVQLVSAPANEYLVMPPAVTAGTKELSVLVGGRQPG